MKNEQSGGVFRTTKIQSDEHFDDSEPCVSHEDDDVVPNQHNLTPIEYMKWRKLALVIEYISVFTVICLSCALFVTSTDTDSCSLFALSIDSVLGIISSATIIWRYSSEDDEDCGSVMNKDKMSSRERKACIVVGVAFVLSATLIFVDAIKYLVFKDHISQAMEVFIISCISVISLGILFFAKFKIARKLKSRAMETDAFDSGAGAITALSIVVCTAIDSTERSFWFLDSVVGILVGIGTFVFGMQTLWIAYKAPCNRNEVKENADSQ